MAAKFQVPFDPNGNQVHYVDSWYLQHQGYTLQDPYEFEDKLFPVRVSKGRSRVTFKLQSRNTLKTYECTLNAFMDMMTSGKCVVYNGVPHVCGRFGFKKVGTTISLMLL